MSKTLEQVQKQLDENIPEDVISRRDGGGGKKLDYLETWYVIDRMNQIFGSLNWSKETTLMQQVPVDGKVTYVAKVRVAVRSENGIVAFRDGTGYGNDKGNFNPHELATKEAESDAFKRAAMQFGRSLGLALYDKSREFVGEKEEAKATNKETTTNKSSPATGTLRASKPADAGNTRTYDTKALRSLIKTAAEVLNSQEKLDFAGFIDEFLKPHKATKVDALKDSEVLVVAQAVGKKYPELQLLQ